MILKFGHSEKHTKFEKIFQEAPRKVWKISGQKSLQYSRCYFGQNDDKKRHFESNWPLAGPRIVSPSLHIRQKRGGKGVIHTHNRTTKAPVTLIPNTEGLDSLNDWSALLYQKTELKLNGSKNHAVVLLFKTISFLALDQKNRQNSIQWGQVIFVDTSYTNTNSLSNHFSI